MISLQYNFKMKTLVQKWMWYIKNYCTNWLPAIQIMYMFIKFVGDIAYDGIYNGTELMNFIYIFHYLIVLLSKLWF